MIIDKYISMRLSFIVFFFVSNSLFSQEIVDYALSPCDINSRVQLIQPRIVTRYLKGDTLFLAIGFRENCGFDLNPGASSKNDTLSLELSQPRPAVFDSLGNEVYEDVIITMCDCCFELELSLIGIKDTNFVLLVNGFEFVHQDKSRIKLPDEYVFDKSKPINQGNKDGLRVGLWRTYFEGTKKVRTETYFDEEWKDPIRRWVKVYNRKGELISVRFRTHPQGIMIDLGVEEYYRILKE
ncbi:MAG: hypothetical protein COA33_014830 [Fluviicola sp.]|nr:hypothetical protein [Fluviicola sp.]